MHQEHNQPLNQDTAATANFNMFAAHLLIRTWQNLGIDTYYVSPGYRDAPFIAALQTCPGVSVVSLFDERAAGYQALGYAKAKGRPAVLLCTSGTAGANYYPAVIEAFVDQVPLLVVTADRPFELVHAGAQQVMDQRQLYGRYSKKCFDLPAPGESLNVRAWVSYARDAVLTAEAHLSGPVHLNLPFRMPLDPVVEDHPCLQTKKRELDETLACLSWEERGSLVRSLSPQAVAAWKSSLFQAERGLLILGRLTRPEEREAALRFAQRLSWPVYADIGSGCQGKLSTEVLDLQFPEARSALDQYRPDCVIHLGRRLVSRQFDEALVRWNPRSYWVFTREPGVQDPSHRSQRVQLAIDLTELDQFELPSLPEQNSAAEILLEAHRALRSHLGRLRFGEFCFADVAQSVVTHAPAAGQSVFLGNSTAIRAFDSWVFEAKSWPRCEANRGVSGIEGLLSTTIGLAKGSSSPWTAVLGDISLLYDMNAVLSLGQERAPVVVVVVNNQGGRIFEMLPLGKYPWLKDPCVSTPHSFDFAGLAQMARLPYVLCEDKQAFDEAYQSALRRSEPCLIECRQAPDVDARYSGFLKSQGFALQS